jgi:hypothetical protein
MKSHEQWGYLIIGELGKLPCQRKISITNPRRHKENGNCFADWERRRPQSAKQLSKMNILKMMQL